MIPYLQDTSTDPIVRIKSSLGEHQQHQVSRSSFPGSSISGIKEPSSVVPSPERTFDRNFLKKILWRSKFSKGRIKRNYHFPKRQ